MAERPEDLNLPNAVIGRIIKDALPEGVNVSKDARLAMAKAASVFVLYATSCANTFTLQHKRKTISGQDVLEAMSEMDFETFVDPLRKSLEAYKKGQQGKKDAAEKKKKSKDLDTSKEDDKEEAEAEEEGEGEADAEKHEEEENGDEAAAEEEEEEEEAEGEEEEER